MIEVVRRPRTSTLGTESGRSSFTKVSPPGRVRRDSSFCPTGVPVLCRRKGTRGRLFVALDRAFPRDFLPSYPSGQLVVGFFLLQYRACSISGRDGVDLGRSVLDKDDQDSEGEKGGRSPGRGETLLCRNCPRFHPSLPSFTTLPRVGSGNGPKIRGETVRLRALRSGSDQQGLFPMRSELVSGLLFGDHRELCLSTHTPEPPSTRRVSLDISCSPDMSGVDDITVLTL